MAASDDTTETKGAGGEGGGEEGGAPAPALSFGRLLGGAGATDTAFARRVQERARRLEGVELGLARTTVGHWRRGMRPRDPRVADLAAAELSDLVGYTVTAGDLGWHGKVGADYAGLGLTLAEDFPGAARALAGLSGRDSRAGLPPSGGPLASGAYAGPALYSVTRVVRLAPEAGTGPASEAAVVAEAAEAYRGLDARYGSAGIRREVATLLHGRAVTASSPESAAGRPESAALAELTQLAGWLAQDCGHHRAAQRYYIQALGLAEHAGDAMFAGRTLSAMSRQVVEFGHLRQGLALARAALLRAGQDAVPVVRAMLHDRHARALAAAGDAGGCAEAASAAEHAVAEAAAHPGEVPAWARHYTEADAAWCQGECSLRLGEPTEAVGHLLRSRAALAKRRTRARIHVEVSLALACLSEGHLDLAGALDASRRALELARGVSSARVTSRLHALDTALSPHRQVAVREWRAAAAGYFRAKRDAPARAPRQPGGGAPGHGGGAGGGPTLPRW